MQKNKIDKVDNIIILGIIFCISMVIIGNILNYKIPFLIVTLIIFLGIYFINLNNSYKIFIILTPIIPLYLAIDVSTSLPLLSAYRLLYLLFIIDELIIKKKISKLIDCIKKDMFTNIIFIYIASLFIATIINFNKTSLVNLISIIIEQILLYYIICINIKSMKTVELIIDLIIKVSLVLSILGVIEYLTSFNIFSLLDTSKRLSSSNYIRMGSLRVSTSFNHSLGYGLYLVLFIPIVMYRMHKSKLEKKKTNLYFDRVTFILMNINLILTGSRSTILILIFQYSIMFLMSSWRKQVIISIVGIIIFGAITIFSISPVGENIPGISMINNNIKMLYDTLLGTNLVDNFGDNDDPFIYRGKLIEYALSKKGKEFIAGQGLGFIRDNPLVFDIPELNPWGPTISYSVDNYYILKFLEVGFIGLIGTIALFFKYLRSIFINIKINYFNKMLFVSMIGYLVNLFMVDQLETIKYLWILLALYSSILRIIKYDANKKIL